MQQSQGKRLPQNVFLSLCIIITSKFPIKKPPTVGVKWLFLSSLWVWSDFDNSRPEEFCYDLKGTAMIWNIGFPIMVFSKVSFSGFPQLQKILSWIGVLFFSKTSTLTIRKSLRVKALTDLILECSFPICLILPPKAHICLEQAAWQEDTGISSSTMQLSGTALYGFPFALIIVYKRWKLCIRGAPLLIPALLPSPGRRWV